MKLDGARVNQKVMRAGRPIGITLEQHRFAPGSKETAEDKTLREARADASFCKLWHCVGRDFDTALARSDVDEAHRIWCRICELWLYFNQDDDNVFIEDELATRKNIPRRGQPLPYLEQDLVSGQIGSPDQRYTGRSWRLSRALLAVRRVLGWIDHHISPGPEGTTRPMAFVKSTDRTNLNRIWRDMCDRIGELDSDEVPGDWVEQTRSWNDHSKVRGCRPR